MRVFHINFANLMCFSAQLATQLVMKVSCDVLEKDLITAATSTITHCVWMSVPVLSYPTLTMSVYVQLELLDKTVQMARGMVNHT